MNLTSMLCVMNVQSAWDGKQYAYSAIFHCPDGSIPGAITLPLSLDEFAKLSALCQKGERPTFQLVQVK